MLPFSLAPLAPLSLFILFVYVTETSGISLQSSADLLDWAFMLAVECNTRSSQLPNVSFLSRHTKHVAINCCIAMSLPMHSAMLASLLSLGPTQVIPHSDQQLC